MIHYRIFLFAALLLAASPAVRAQDSVRYSTLSLHAGPAVFWHKDMFRSPYTYKSVGLGASLGYSAYRAHHHVVATLSYMGGALHPDDIPPANITVINLRGDYLFLLGSGQRKLEPSLGVGIHTLLNSARYLPDDAAAKTYLSAAGYVMVTGALQYTFSNRSTLTLQASLPVMGVLHRPDFDANGKALTEVASPFRSPLFYAKAEYVHKLRRNFDLTLGLDCNYFATDSPRSFTVLQAAASFGFRKRF